MSKLSVQTIERRARRWLATLALGTLLALAGCTANWSLDPDAPARATSTPAPNLQGEPPGGALLKPAPPSQPPTTAELAHLSTVEQLRRVVAPQRDLRDLALRYMPELGDIPQVVNAHLPDYAVGDRLEFWVHEMGANRDFTITAELLHKTDVAYAWVEVDQPVDRARIAAAVDRFSRRSYPAVTAFFGSEWNPGVDNDPRLHILHATGIGGSIAGYYSSTDQYSSLARARSNEKEMFYINLGWLNSSRNYDYYETVLAHEFQHMIHWYRDRNEETWVNEGLSEFAQEIAGFPPNTSPARDFAAAPDTQLTTWGTSSTGNSAHYGSAYLFTAYFAQRFGPELTRALVAHPANGARGFDAVLAGADYTLTFDDLFADWVVANYVGDAFALGRDGVYGYRNFRHAAPRLEATHDRYPSDVVATTVANYGTDYVRLTGSGDAVIHFRGATDAQLAALPPVDDTAHRHTTGGRLWWSNRGDDFNTRLTRRVDLTAVAPSTPISMTATFWWDIEAGYDYGYVAMSFDGQTWALLSGSSTVNDVGGTALGPGYTGSSGGWQREQFDLSPYAGQAIYLRFELVADDAINSPGWFIDEVAIPAIGWADDFAGDFAGDFEGGASGWESEGWLLTDNSLPQGWIVQLLTFDDEVLVGVERIAINDQGRASIPVSGLGNGRTAVLAISGAAPATTEPAAYEYWIDRP